MTSAQPAKPLRADARRNRQRVLDAARAAFVEDGVTVPLDEIARRASVGPGTVYRHFPTKEALFAAIVVADVEALAAEARALAAGDDDPGDALVGFIGRMIDEGVASKAMKDALAGVFDIQVAAPEVAGELRAAVAELLAGAQRTGAVRDDIDIADLIALVVGVFAAVEHHEDGTDRGRRLLAVVVAGLRAR